ncbi:MAG TPA: polysaccharide deacetylase family protein [Burkholderiaceae bacterium]|nr:polysaccharide deacetylase family protein [Burkholderiaceae bacterium]
MLRLLLALLLWLAPVLAFAQVIGLTFDDGLDPTRNPKAELLNTRILHALEEQQLHAIVFPALSLIGGERGLALVEQWAAAGHGVGNHTATHRSLGSTKVSLSSFIADVQRADEALHEIDTFVPMLRFPYLKEGDTAAKRDGMRQWMHEHGYRSAPVSIDTSDSYYNQRYLALRAAGRSEPVKRLKRAYVQHLLQRADYYDGLARQVIGRSPAHVMLLHTNALNAEALPEVIEAFRTRGWHFVAARTAFDDPLYAMQPMTLPAGESIIWALAKERGVEGLRYPTEDAAYERPQLQRLGLAP